MARKPKLNGLNIAPHVHGEAQRVLEVQKAAFLGKFDSKRSMSDVVTEALKVYIAKFRTDFALGVGEIPDPKTHPAEFELLVRRVAEERELRDRSGEH